MRNYKLLNYFNKLEPYYPSLKKRNKILSLAVSCKRYI